MKKIVTVLMLCITITLTSCDRIPGSVVEHENNRNFEDASIGNLELVDVTFRGETHEYVFYIAGYKGSLSHWAGCKYCKNKKMNINIKIRL